MTIATRMAAPALLGALLLAAPVPARAADQRETERVDRTARIRPDGRLTLRNFSGRVTITGSSRADVAIHAVRRAARERLDHVALDVQEDAGDVIVEANKRDRGWHVRGDDVVETEFDIEVPADVSVDVQVFSSDVSVRDVRGRQRVHTFSGDVDLLGSGTPVDAETFSGNIEVRVAQGTSASVDFDSFSGSIRTDLPLTYRSSSRRHVRVDIGAGGPDYTFKTFSGNLRIH